MKFRLIAWLPALTACSAPFSAVDETLRDSEVRTAALEEHFTLYAPYDVERSQPFVEMVDENIGALFRTLGVGFVCGIVVAALARPAAAADPIDLVLKELNDTASV